VPFFDGHISLPRLLLLRFLQLCGAPAFLFKPFDLRTRIALVAGLLSRCAPVPIHPHVSTDWSVRLPRCILAWRATRAAGSFVTITVDLRNAARRPAPPLSGIDVALYIIGIIRNAKG